EVPIVGVPHLPPRWLVGQPELATHALDAVIDTERPGGDRHWRDQTDLVLQKEQHAEREAQRQESADERCAPGTTPKRPHEARRHGECRGERPEKREPAD